MVRRFQIGLAAGLALAGSGAATMAGTLCTLVVDSKSGVLLTEKGDCETRVTPASTFKVALAAIGFEEGLLQGPHEPVRQYRKGEVDWAGRTWRGRVDPTSWMKHSVVWYSQRLTRQLGAEKLEAPGAGARVRQCRFFGGSREAQWP
jgi:beta-lactamase class D